MLGLDLHDAIGASRVARTAGSRGAAAAYVKEGYSNIRVGMFLEIATTLGALLGAVLVLYLRAPTIAIIFGVVLIYSAYASLTQTHHEVKEHSPDRIATWLRMDSRYPTPHGSASH